MWKPYKSYAEKARQIIGINRYMVLATSSKDAKPWAATVFYAYDEDYNFYFVSAIDSTHIKNIMENPFTAVDILDSRQYLGSSEQVQIYGKVSAVEKEGLKEAVGLYHKRLFEKSRIADTSIYNIGDYVEPSEFRMFKIVPMNVYTDGPERRVEVDLKE